MRKNILMSLTAGALLVFSTSSASAMDLSVTIDFGSSSIANGITMVDANTATANLSTGDVIAVVVTADNLTADIVSAIFSTLAWDGTQLSFLGGGFTGSILVGTCTGFSCAPPSLGPGIGAPVLKPLSPFNQNTGVTDWLQTIAHTNPGGTNGTGPDNVTGTMGFQVLAGGAGTDVNIAMIIEPNSDTVAGAGGGAFLGPLNLIDANIFVPEAGTLAMSMASLFSVGLIVVRRRGNRA